MATDEQSCRQISHSHLESMTGTAPHAPAWLLVEYSAAWAPQAPKDVAWPPDLNRELQDRVGAAGVRLGLIRRVPAQRRSVPGAPAQVLLAYTGPAHPWVRSTTVGDPAELLDLDLAGLGAGRVPDLAEIVGGVFAVCTHGSRDACCARVGRPVANALTERFGSAVWEASHVGGHRFAANLLCFPHGLMFGRAAADTGLAIAEAYQLGQVSPDYLRGRTCWPGPVQAAEQHLRAELGATGVEDVVVTGWVEGEVTEVDLLADGTTHRLQVQGVPRLPARPFSCGPAKLEVPVDWKVTRPGSPAGPGG